MLVKFKINLVTRFQVFLNHKIFKKNIVFLIFQIFIHLNFLIFKSKNKFNKEELLNKIKINKSAKTKYF